MDAISWLDCPVDTTRQDTSMTQHDKMEYIFLIFWKEH